MYVSKKGKNGTNSQNIIFFVIRFFLNFYFTNFVRTFFCVNELLLSWMIEIWMTFIHVIATKFHIFCILTIM